MAHKEALHMGVKTSSHVKDMFLALGLSELCNGLLGVANHVTDGVWLNGIIPLTHFELGVVLGPRREENT